MKHLALIALVLLAGCGKPDGKPTPTAASAPALPASQTAFLALPRTGAASDDFCTRFKAFVHFDNWQGKVQDLRISTLDGTADLEINIGQGTGGHGIRLEAVVAKADPVYPALMTLSLGQAIIVSGKFTHANNDADCIYYNGPFGVHLSALKG